MNPTDDADDPLFVALRGLPALDVAPRRAQRVAARCRAAIAAQTFDVGSVARPMGAVRLRTAGLAAVIAWSAVYVVAIVHRGMIAWGW